MRGTDTNIWTKIHEKFMKNTHAVFFFSNLFFNPALFKGKIWFKRYAQDGRTDKSDDAFFILVVSSCNKVLLSLVFVTSSHFLSGL